MKGLLRLFSKPSQVILLPQSFKKLGVEEYTNMFGQGTCVHVYTCVSIYKCGTETGQRRQPIHKQMSITGHPSSKLVGD